VQKSKNIAAFRQQASTGTGTGTRTLECFLEPEENFLTPENEVRRSLRNWKKDYEIAEAFCEKYGMCYGEIVYEGARYNIFFSDVDGDEVECCLTENTGDLRADPRVKYTDILLYIPLNERNLHTNIEKELTKFCLAKGIVK